MEYRTKESQIPTRDLTDGDRAVLYSLAQSDGYRVLLDILHRFVTGEEKELLNTSPDDERVVIGQWHNSRACWAMFARMQREIKEAAEDFKQGMAEATIPRGGKDDRSVEDVLGVE